MNAARGAFLLFAQSQTLLNAFSTEPMQTLHDETRLAHVAQTDGANEFGIQIFRGDLQTTLLCGTRNPMQIVERQIVMRKGFFPFRVGVKLFVERHDGGGVCRSNE